MITALLTRLLAAPGATLTHAATSPGQTESTLAYASLDNRIRIWSTVPELRPSPHKPFGGHRLGGHAITPALSPNGAYLSCGDASGGVWHWDWQSGRVMRQEEGAHAGPVLCVLWHPHESSRVLSCSLDGTIKLWD